MAHIARRRSDRVNSPSQLRWSFWLFVKFTFLGLFLTLALVMMVAEPAEIVATLASDSLGMHVKLSKLSLSSPTTVTIKNVYLAGGRFPRPIGARKVDVDFSPLAGLMGSPFVTSVDLTGLTLRVTTDKAGDVDDRTRAELASIGLVLTGLDPQLARARGVTLLLSSPLLPGTRKLVGKLTFIAEEGGYRAIGRFDNEELNMRLEGRMYKKSKHGDFTVKVSTRQKGTELLCEMGSKAIGRFDYCSKLSFQGEDDALEIEESEGICQIKDMQLHLPWFKEAVQCSTALVLKGPPINVQKAKLTVSGMSFDYRGSLSPSRENPGHIYLTPLPLAKLLKNFQPKTPPLPAYLKKASVTGEFVIEGQDLEDISGHVNIRVPAKSLPAMKEDLIISAAVSYRRGELHFKNGSLCGPLAVDAWQGRLDTKSQNLDLEICRLHSPLAMVEPFAREFIRGEGNIMASLRVTLPLNSPQEALGELAFSVIPAFASKEVLPWGVTNAQGLVRFSPDELNIKKCRLSGREFTNFEFQGKRKKDGKVSGLFLARGLLAAPGGSLNSITGEVTQDNELLFTLREPGGTEIRCEGGLKGAPQTITAQFGDLKITAKGELPNFTSLLTALSQKRVPEVANKIFTVTVQRPPMEVHSTISLISFLDGTLSMRSLSGRINTPFVHLEQVTETKVAVDDKSLSFTDVQFKDKSGGSLFLSGRIPFSGMPTIEGRAASLVVQHPSFPPLRLSGRAELRWQDKKPLLHAALVAARRQNKGRFRTLSCLLSTTEKGLNIRRLRVRTSDGEIHLSGNLPLEFDEDFSPSLTNGSLFLTMNGRNFDLGCLREVTPSMPISSGLLTGSLQLAGTTRNPSLQGHLAVSAGKLILPGTLGALDGVAFQATLQDDSLVVEDVAGSWNSMLNFDCSHIAVTSIRLTPLMTASIVAADGNLSINDFKVEGLDFQGNIASKNLLNGTLKAERISWLSETSEMLSEDKLREYVARAEPIVQSKFKVDVNVETPRNVRVRTSSIAAEFGGKLQVQVGGGNCSASGELAVLRGDLFLQGQRFKLSRGTLGFARDPGLEIGGLPLLVPLPRMDIRGETTVLGTPIEIRLRGNPLVDRGMVAHLNSTTSDYSQDRLVQLMSFDEREGRAAAAPFLNEIGYRLLSTGLERSLKKYLPFDDIGIGGGFSFGKDKRPTITMGRYLGKDVYLNLEGGFAPSESFLKELEIDLKPLDGNVRLSFAKDFTTMGDGETTMALEYSLRF